MRTCQGLTRRAFLQVGGSTVLGLSLADRLRAGAPTAGSAKSVILLWLWGGPSHLDTFDPKPLLDRDHGKPFPGQKPRVTFAKTGTLLKSPWKFKQHGKSGIPVSELFPHVAGCVDDLCLIHSLHGTNPAHGGAVLKLHTGSDNFVRPSMGAWVAYGLGFVGYVASLAYQLFGFYARVSISGRPPVTNMYETVVWVACMASLFALVLELFFRKNIIILAGSVLLTLPLIVVFLILQKRFIEGIMAGAVKA